MTTYPLLYADNAHSLRRMLMLWRLYWPTLRIGVIICIVFPILMYSLAGVIANLTGVYVDINYYCPILELLPLLLAFRDYRHISSQLPVTAGEKMIFLIVVFFVIFPGLLSLSELVGQWLLNDAFGQTVHNLFNEYNQKIMSTLKDNQLQWMRNNIFVGYGFAFALISVELYYIVTAKKNRIVAGLLSLLFAYLGICLIFAFVSAVVGIIIGYNSADETIPEEVIRIEMLHSLKWVIAFAFGSIATIAIVYLIKLYKKLRNCGF